MVVRKCPVCQASVKLENLERHVASVHPQRRPSLSLSDEDRREIRFARRNLRGGFHIKRSTVVIAVALVLVAAGTIAAVPYLRHAGGEIHWHAHLAITINGEAAGIPANIGIDPNLWHDHSLDSYSSMQAMPWMGMQGMAPLHTHPDGPGKVHIESSVARDYTLSEFFRIWGQSFDNSQVLGHVADPGHRIWMVIDGAEASVSSSLVLRDGISIEIHCG